MQKKLIALAVAGLASTGAFAQSNVQIYGLLDLGYQHLSATGRDSVNRVGSMSSNLWGLKGTEDLGNGLKAGFNLEAGLASDVGGLAGGSAGKVFSRQSFLSLSGGFGTALVGRFNTFGRTYGTVKYSASPLSAVDGVGLLSSAAGFTISGNGIDTDATGGRISNGIAYVSPSFSGVTVGYAHSFAENAGNTVGANQFNINELWVGYGNGPLSVDYIYNNVNSSATPAAAWVQNQTTGAFAQTGLNQATVVNAIGPIQEHFLGAAYDFGTVKVLGSYQTRKTEATNTDKVWNLGALIPVSAAGKVSVSYAKLSMGSDLRGNNNPLGAGAGVTLASASIGLLPAGGVLDNASAWALGYYHSLSKRTTAYTTYTHAKNDGNGTIGFTNAANSNPTAGGSTNLFSLGLQHAF